MRFWLAAALAALLAASIPAYAQDTEVCVTEAVAAKQLTEAGAGLAAYLHDDAAHSLIKLMPPLPDPWKAEDFKSVMLWAVPHGQAILILFDNNGCAQLKAIVDLDAALNAVKQVQRDA